LKCLNRERWEQRVCPLGIWSFCACLGEKPCWHVRAMPLPVRLPLQRFKQKSSQPFSLSSNGNTLLKFVFV